MKPRELINHINPPQYLSTLIAYAVASDILHIFEKEYPNDLRPRKAMDLVKRYLDGEDVSREELMSARISTASATYAATAAAYAAYAAADAAGCAATSATYAAYAAAYWTAKVTSEEHVVNSIYSLMPKFIDYAIKNQVKLFTGSGDFSEVFDKLDDETREKVIWNLELFRCFKSCQIT